MSNPEWKKGKVKSFGSPKEAFSAILKEPIYFGVIGKDETPCLKLEFEKDIILPFSLSSLQV